MMWIFRKHRHLSPATLSEYLDGRLDGAAREKVARELASCASCREELESLRATVSLLQDLPELRAPRSFTLAGPPPVLVAAPPPAPLRMPNWAYAGAASLAGLALAVLVSADATGLLAPGPEAPAASSQAQESAAATAVPDALAAIPVGTPAPQSPAATPEPESMQSFRAMPGAEDTGGAGESTATPVPDQETMAFSAPAPGAEPSTAEGAGPGETPAPVTGADDPSVAAPPPAENKASDEAPVAAPEALPQRDAGGEEETPLVWRALEGVAAALALAFLAGLILRWRQSRRIAGN